MLADVKNRVIMWKLLQAYPNFCCHKMMCSHTYFIAHQSEGTTSSYPRRAHRYTSHIYRNGTQTLYLYCFILYGCVHDKSFNFEQSSVKLILFIHTAIVYFENFDHCLIFLEDDNHLIFLVSVCCYISI